MWWVHPLPPPWSLQQYDPLSILKRRQSQINKTISLLNYIYLHFYQIYYFTTQQATNFCKFQNLRSIHWCKYIWYWYISFWVFYRLYKMKKKIAYLCLCDRLQHFYCLSWHPNLDFLEQQQNFLIPVKENSL